jgi:hypothetical protein
MRALTNAQRAGMLERLKHNHKYDIVVSYAGTFPKKKALKFAAVFQEAGWKVSGPFLSEDICTEGLGIAVPDTHSPCPSAHLLIDVLVSVGIDARVVSTAEHLPSDSNGCSLLLGPSGRKGAARRVSEGGSRLKV